MPPEPSATDRYLAEIDRLLDVRGRSRRRTLAAVRRRLSQLLAEERADGVTEEEEEEERALRAWVRPSNSSRSCGNGRWRLGRAARLSSFWPPLSRSRWRCSRSLWK